jgi:hypothetical protein
MPGDFRTHTGRLVSFLDPRPEDIDIADIAHHLARTGRFGGAVDDFYSVASHSVYVSRRLAEEGYPPYVQLAGLLHDSAEAYLGDVVSGLKRLLPQYYEIEHSWDTVLQQVFGVWWRDCPAVKDADLRARRAEARDLFAGRPYDLSHPMMYSDYEPYATRVVPETPDEAEFSFLSRAAEFGVVLP